MKPSVLIISGWAHGIDAIKPMGDIVADHFDVYLMAGNEVLKNRTIPETDCIVAGSMGGLLAMELLPESCRKLVLISSTAKFCAGDGYPCGTQEKVLRRMIAQLKREPEAVLDEFFKNVHFPKRESRHAASTRRNARLDLADLVAGLEYLLASDVREKVPGIELPVLLMHGTGDRIIPAAASEWLHEHLPNGRIEIFGNEGHALPAHNHSTVMALLLAFLKE